MSSSGDVWGRFKRSIAQLLPQLVVAFTRNGASLETFMEQLKTVACESKTHVVVKKKRDREKAGRETKKVVMGDDEWSIGWVRVGLRLWFLVFVLVVVDFGFMREERKKKNGLVRLGV